MEEIKVILKDGTVALINEVPPAKDGKKRYIITSEDGSFDMFSYTPEGIGGDNVSPQQRAVALEIDSQLPK